ncbi:phage head closure protein [Citrobacter freundii]|nr:phage head closure protein [Citrobacter freundii]MBA8333663.1 phage head closure protein [Citrobacter freundii]MBA8334574.1 phage head closure protein [Citrobacter freundii]QLM85414.1 phage head closure protein [Citrobacter freundii]QLM86288.1 phage head closure protein [Citrobacter freundii]
MKIRQAQTSATYLLPDPGELDKRVRLRLRVDTPSADFGVEPDYPVSFLAWAKVVQTSATTYQETAQTDEAVTHYITIRYRRGITSDFEVVHDGKVYRVRRGRDLNGKRRFLLLECTELGEFPATHGGGSNGGTLFTR